jgi:hypothetical protein
MDSQGEVANPDQGEAEQAEVEGAPLAEATASAAPDAGGQVSS